MKWDRIHRLNNWLITYLNARSPGNDEEQWDAFIRYACAIGSKWMISAVARIFKPGSKADSCLCLILEGPQGLGKSTVFRILGGDWFTDEMAEVGSKDATLQTRGVWIIELGELDAMSRADSSKTKAFMSRSVDRFRPPYAKWLIASPRQCVFGGTCNQDTYLKDETGGRRFWPIRCGDEIHVDELTRDRDQLWAEALHRFNTGESWWLDSPMLVSIASDEQSDRFEADPWQPPIKTWLIEQLPNLGRDYASSEEILETVIQKKKADWTQIDKNRVARCLKALGCRRLKRGPRTARAWRYYMPSKATDSVSQS